MKFNEKVKYLRKITELTQEQLANELGVTFSTINRWENGKSKPNRLTLNVFNMYFESKVKNINKKTGGNYEQG